MKALPSFVRAVALVTGIFVAYPQERVGLSSSALTAPLLASPLFQQDPPFRSQVNAASVDVVVTDKSGHIVRSLTADDFLVNVNKRPRRIVSMEFIDAKSTGGSQSATFPESTPAVAQPSTNSPAERGRVFIFAIAAGMIGRGAGRLQMQQISQFLDRLGPQDMVGVVSLPTFMPRVELTRDRIPIRAALESVVGTGERYRPCGPTFGEAATFLSGDVKGELSSMADRKLLPPSLYPGQTLTAVAEYRLETRMLLDSLGALSDALAGTPGPKTIVLVAEGFLADPELREHIGRLAERTEAAGTRVYALHLDTPTLDPVTRGNTTSAHDMDDHFGFDAMSDVAVATGGTAFRVVGSAMSRLDQIDEESSGYYVLGVELDPAERGETKLDLSVKSRRSGLDVRARSVVSAQPPRKPAAPSTADEASVSVARLLQSPINMSEIPMSVDTVASPVLASPTTRYVLITDVSVPANTIAAMGFHLATLDGRTIAYKIESPVTLATDGTHASHLVALDLTPGPYRLRVSGIAANGSRGSVERLFTVSGVGAGLSDILLGAENANPWIPIATVAPGQKRLGVRVELAAGASVSDKLSATLLIGLAGNPRWIGQADLTIAGEGAIRTASGAINIDQLQKGRYLLRVERRINGELTAVTAKAIDIR